jgi:hypothetical protein
VSAEKIIDFESWEQAVDMIHRLVAGEPKLARRVRMVADAFVGRPYVIDPLIGGPKVPEKLVIRFDAFDCITFIESVLALAKSTSRKGFISELKKARYRDGVVAWSSRLHYFSDWMRHNQKRGAIKIRTRGSGARSIDTAISLIKALPARRIRIHVVPKKDIGLALHRISNGSVVAFASVRPTLDFFHTGLIFSGTKPVRSVEELLLYSPPKSIGKVIAEPLSDFLKRNRMRGLAFATILEPGDFK